MVICEEYGSLLIMRGRSGENWTRGGIVLLFIIPKLYVWV